MTENKFGLVYTGALTENTAEGIHLKPVSYKNRYGIEIAANLYLPAAFDATNTYAAVVVAHPNGGVKEQVSGLFAQALAEAGFVALAFDAAYQGASQGLPRQTDIPANRVEDIRAGIDFLQTVEGVDVNRIGALGICGGGGYTIEVSKSDKRIKAVATVSAFNTGRVRRNGFKDSQIDSIQERLTQASAAREKFAQTGEVDYIGELLTHRIQFTPEQLEQIPAGLYRDGTQYYGDTHYHPNSQSRYTAMSLMDLMDFDAENQMELIDQPLLMMTGDISDTRYMTDAIFEKATGTDDKRLIYIEGANHIETYWVPEFVEQEKKEVLQFFGEKLS